MISEKITTEITVSPRAGFDNGQFGAGNTSQYGPGQGVWGTGMSGAIGATGETTLPVGQSVESTAVPNIPALASRRVCHANASRVKFIGACYGCRAKAPCVGSNPPGIAKTPGSAYAHQTDFMVSENERKARRY